MKELNNQKGYAAVLSVLIISFVVIAISITVSLLGIGQGQSSLALSQGENTLQFVEGCMEDALLKVGQNASYAGGSITRPEGTCTITVSQSGTTYTVTATTTATIYKRTVQAIVNRGSALTITSWQEQ